jgi:hypothetical protein
LDKRGWQQLPFDYSFSNRFGLKWVERRGHIDYKSHTDGQLVCHIPNNDVLSTKVGLLHSLRSYYGPGRCVKWIPETFDLDLPQDCQNAINIETSRDGKNYYNYNISVIHMYYNILTKQYLISYIFIFHIKNIK